MCEANTLGQLASTTFVITSSNALAMLRSKVKAYGRLQNVAIFFNYCSLPEPSSVHQNIRVSCSRPCADRHCWSYPGIYTNLGASYKSL